MSSARKALLPGKAGPLLLVQSSIRLHPQPGGLEGRTTIVRTVEGRRVSIDDERPPRERRLRDLIAGSPSLLPDVDERPAAVSTEVRISGAGKADVIVVDAGGEITIVECKLAKNPQMRRWVIGQLFEYAAALWRLDIEDLERGLAAGGTASTEPFKDTARWQEAAFRSTVSGNLADGAFRLIIAVDEITERLKRTVVFINGLVPPEVRFWALELHRAGETGVPRPVPVRYGDNNAEIGPLTPTWPPDRKSLLDGIRVRSTDAARAAEGLLDWAERKQEVTVRYWRRERDGIEMETCAIEAPDRDRLFRIKEQREGPSVVHRAPSAVGRRTHQRARRRPRQDRRAVPHRHEVQIKEAGSAT
jgi:hypothetical protein